MGTVFSFPLHRVARADLAGEITASIICPGVIFGRGTGPSKTISSPFPNLVRLALKHERAVYAGEVCCVLSICLLPICHKIPLRSEQSTYLYRAPTSGRMSTYKTSRT